MANNDFNLPGSSAEEIDKIIEAYAQRSQPSTNEDIAQLTGLTKETVSRNNKFLVSIGLISGGQQKRITELGEKLGKALHHAQLDDVRKHWQEAVTGNAFLSEQITAVRVQKGVKSDALPGKILYNAGASKNKQTETGARAVADILVRAGLLELQSDTYQVARGTRREPESDVGVVERPDVPDEQKASVRPVETQVVEKVVYNPAATPFQVAINLQLQLPEFEDPSKYEELFRALRKNLLSPSSE